MRAPVGYAGRDHITIGSDILAVEAALRALVPGERQRRGLLGRESFEWLVRVQPNAWYPVQSLLDLMARIAERSGRSALTRIGRLIFDQSHRPRLDPATLSGQAIVFGIDAMYHHANRGRGIGGWRVLEFDAYHALLEKTTPHHCAVEEGFLSEALAVAGVRTVIEQPQCIWEEGKVCRIEIRPVTDSGRWLGETGASAVV